MKLRSLVLFLVLVVGGYSVNAQCGNEVVVAKDWCDNQYAEWEITNPETNTKYHWYEQVYAGGVIVDTIDRGYGFNDPDGITFTSPFRYQDSSPASNDRFFWYQKEANKVQGMAEPTTSIGNQGVNSGYLVNFNADQQFLLEEVTIPIHSYYVDPNSTFYVQIRIGTDFSEIFYFKNTDLTVQGNVYYLTVPVGIDVAIGDNQELEVITNPAAPQAGTTQIANLAWFSTGQYNYTARESEGFDITGSASSSGNRAMVFDWKMTAYCDFEVTPPATLTTVDCCVPVLGNVEGSITEPTIVSLSESSTITLTAFESASNYFQWYKDGVAMTGENGQQLTVNEAAVYTVREVETSADLNEFSCYASKSFTIQERVLFADLISPSPQPSTYCVGDELTLEATGDVTSLNWVQSSLVSNPSSRIVDVVITDAMVGPEFSFEVIADVIQGNLIQNGDFETGNIGPIATSSMTAVTGTPSPAQYLIGDIVPASQSDWENINPANQCKGDGNFLIADGFGGGFSAEPIVWEYTLSGIDQNKDFVFSMDHTQIGWADGKFATPRPLGPAAEFTVLINGSPLKTFTTQAAVDGVCDALDPTTWHTEEINWNSGSNTTANIKILAAPSGNRGADFAIDNIRFGGPASQSATVTVGPIENCFDVLVSRELCDGDSVRITAAGINTVTGDTIGTVDRWEDDATPSANIVGKTASVYVSPTQSTTYTAYVSFPGSSLIQNGDYELGVNGFTYGGANGYYEQGNSPGSFTVLSDATTTACGTGCTPQGDHTTGSGSMLFVDPTNADGNVIGYTFNAESGKDYIFSLWIANAVEYDPIVNPNIVNYNPAEANVSFLIGGQEIAAIQLEENNDWVELSSVWTSNVTGAVTLEIFAKGDATLVTEQGVNEAGQTTGGGNDFLIDDFRLTTALDNQLFETITIEPCCTPATITTQPKDSTVCEGNNATFTVEATGTSLAYQWQVSTDGGLNWTDLTNVGVYSGVSTNTLTITGATSTLDANQYRVEILIGSTCPAISEEVTLTLDALPTASITTSGTALAYCSGGTGVTLAAASAGSGAAFSGATYSWYEWNGTDTTAGGVGVTSQTPTDLFTGTQEYVVVVENGLCVVVSSPVEVVENVTPDVSVIDPTKVCSGTPVDLTSVWTDAASAPTPTVKYEFLTTPPATYLDVTSGAGAVSDSGLYRVIVTSGVCADTTAINVVVNALPTGSISIDTDSICDDGVSFATVSGTATGLAPFTFYYDSLGTQGNTVINTSSGDLFTTSTAGVISLDSIVDDNGCKYVGQAMDVVSLDYYEDVVALAATECDDIHSDLTNSQFKIRLTVSQGDLSSIDFEELNSSTGVSFNPQGSGVWLSTAISETDTIDLRVFDKDGCNGGDTIADITRLCSCPVRIDSVAFDADSICAEGSTALNVYYKGATSGNYNLTLTDPLTAVLTENGQSGPSTVFTPVSEKGRYSVEVAGIDDNCSVSAEIDLNHFDQPLATISGGKSICAVDSSALLTVTLTAGKSPFTIDVAGAESHSLNSADEAPFNSDTVSVTIAGTYTLDNLTDANGCITVAADLSSTTTITTVTPPTATITDPSVRELSISEATTAYTVTATPPVAPAYVGSWSAAGMGDFAVVAGNGDLTNLNQTVEDDGKTAATSVVVWKVDDADGVCPSATDTVDIVRRKLTRPNAENDTLCLTPTNGVFTLVPLSQPNTTNGETAEWIAVGSSPAASMNTTTYALQTTFTERGEYTYRYKISNTSVNASDSIDIVIVVDSIPNISSAQLVGDDFGCQDTTKFYEITGVANADSYRWDIPSGFTAKTLNNTKASDSLIFSGTTPGTVRIYASNEVCGENTTPVALTINDIRLKPQDTPVIDGLSPVCENTLSTKYGASSADADSYTWNWGSINKLTQVDVADSLELVASDFAGKTSGIITVLPVNSCGVNANRAGTFTVTINSIVTPAVELVSDKTNNLFCIEDGTVKFTANPLSGAGTSPQYEFTVVGSGLPPVISSNNEFTTTLSQDKTQVQVIMYSDASCRSQDEAIATIEMREVVPAIINLTQKDEVCYGEPITVALQVQPSRDPNATIKWFNNDVEELDKQGKPEFTLTKTGNYTYKATYKSSICNVDQETDDIDVTIWEQPIIDFSGFLVEEPYNVQVDTKVPTTTTFPVSVLGVTNDPMIYDWKGIGIDDPTKKDLTITYAPNQEGYFDYSLLVSNNNFLACFDEASFQILAAVSLSIPNAFSPNGDDVNDTWEIPGIGRYPEAVVKVFNRWGNLIDERKVNKVGPWDGNGSPVGTYYYIINLQSEVIKVPLTGAVNIVR